jgi:hypothetical protein
LVDTRASPQASRRWFYAEAATGSFFDSFVLLSNPQTADAHVTIEYLLASGEDRRPETRPRAGRVTVSIDNEADVRLHEASIAMRITSDVPELASESFGAVIAVTNGLTTSVEQSVCWDEPGVFWVAGTNTVGTKLP